jgi:hypothetical protein
MDYAIEVAVDGNVILMTLDKLTHGVADVDLVGEDDKTLQRTVPVWLLLILKGIPREEAVAIGQQQAVHTQVATYCHQSVILTKVRVRKP